MPVFAAYAFRDSQRNDAFRGSDFTVRLTLPTQTFFYSGFFAKNQRVCAALVLSHSSVPFATRGIARQGTMDETFTGSPEEEAAPTGMFSLFLAGW